MAKGSLSIKRSNTAVSHTVISTSYNNSSSGVNLTSYSGVILTPKRSLKNSFSGVKMIPDIEELK